MAKERQGMQGEVLNGAVSALNRSLRERLVAANLERVRTELDKVVDDVMAQAEVELKQMVEDITIEEVHQVQDMLNFSEKLIVRVDLSEGT